YWEKRGWHGTGPVNTVAKLWAVDQQDDQIKIGGYAYAGTRGIQAVEVSVDGGDTWEKATLGPQLEGVDVWRQWTFQWRPTRNHHEVTVRAIDGKGNLQPREESQPYPSGATGWVTQTIRVE
ncbi:MAG: sulfite oxidase, partial [Halobacteriaceae archaeon]